MIVKELREKINDPRLKADDIVEIEDMAKGEFDMNILRDGIMIYYTTLSDACGLIKAQ